MVAVLASSHHIRRIVGGTCSFPCREKFHSVRPLAHCDFQIRLLNEPRIERLKLRAWVCQLEVEFAHQLRNQLAHLHHRNVFSQTSSCTVAELKKIVLLDIMLYNFCTWSRHAMVCNLL